MQSFAPDHRFAPAGFFVAFEGGDGAGKTTQRDLLAAHLERVGWQVTLAREPGGTPLGREIRQLLLHGEHVSARAEALLYAADRAHHVAEVVLPALAAGGAVITDRFLDSSVAYQGGARKLGRHEVRDLSLWATEGLVPHLTFLLDVPASVGAKRRQNADRAGEDRLEREALDFHERVRAVYLDLAGDAGERYVVLDGTVSVEELGAQVAAAADAFLAAHGIVPGKGARA
ncbi:dTMP kinase [Buchananella hordeovulneris]|uniref:dTMP kinase n=1 Tax=Buchananella hordeovulneris TaxID=52770 RepID=UPI000F5EA947|nr:dTMP kinase [Buchananella hordeovulneris]RRD53541.1 dTMP kinase [Buchananella hordeovulneris]